MPRETDESVSPQNQLPRCAVGGGQVFVDSDYIFADRSNKKIVVLFLA